MSSERTKTMNKYYYSFLAMITIPLAGMSTDIYIPSLPYMAIDFHVIKSLTQYTVTSYVLAMGIAQLFAGPVSDAFGRKKQLLLALLLQVISVLVILHSPNIYVVIAARFFQGLGAAFMIVPARAILNDIFTGDQLKKHFNYLTISFAIGPIIAPFIGGYLQHYIGWQANFYVILFYALILIFLYSFTYQETCQNTRPFSIDRLGKSYRTIFTNSYFIAGSLLAGMLVGYSSLFNLVGTFLIQTSLHKSAITYGHIALLMGLAWLIGNTINRFTFRISRKVKAQVTLLIALLAAITSVVLGIMGFFNLLSLVLPTLIMVMMGGVIFAAYVSECLSMFPDHAASSNGALFAIAWLIFTVYTYIASLIKVHSLLPLALSYFVISIACLLIFYLLLLRHEKKLATQ